MSLINELLIAFKTTFAPLPCTIEDNPYSRATTPDQLIAAAIIQSFASEFDDWVVRYFHEYTSWDKDHGNRANDAHFINEKKGLSVTLEHQRKGVSNSSKFEEKYRFPFNMDSMRINNIEVSHNVASDIVAAWTRLSKQHEKAKQVAATALREQKANEAKWNLAEKLLGMKRNEFGALVPVNPCTEEGLL